MAIASTTKKPTSTVNITGFCLAKYHGFNFVIESISTLLFVSIEYVNIDGDVVVVINSLLLLVSLSFLLPFLSLGISIRFTGLFLKKSFIIYLTPPILVISYIENGPITINGKNVNAVSRNVITTNTDINNGPCVLMGSITSFLSFMVNEPAIANIKPNGTNLPNNITIPIDQFQNG